MTKKTPADAESPPVTPRRQLRMTETETADGKPMTLIQHSHYLRPEDAATLDAVKNKLRVLTGDTGIDVSSILRGTVSVLEELASATPASSDGKVFKRIEQEALRLRNPRRSGPPRGGIR